MTQLQLGKHNRQVKCDKFPMNIAPATKFLTTKFLLTKFLDKISDDKISHDEVHGKRVFNEYRPLKAKFIILLGFDSTTPNEPNTGTSYLFLLKLSQEGQLTTIISNHKLLIRENLHENWNLPFY